MLVFPRPVSLNSLVDIIDSTVDSGVWISGMTSTELVNDITSALRFSSYVIRQIELDNNVTLFVHINWLDNGLTSSTYECDCKVMTSLFGSEESARSFAKRFGLDTKHVAHGHEGYICYGHPTDLSGLIRLISSCS